MLDYEKIADKTTIQYLSNSILHSPMEPLFQETYPYRIKQAESFLDDGLKDALSDKDYKAVESIKNTYSADIVKIYFSMGIKAGAHLMNQLLDTSDTDY